MRALQAPGGVNLLAAGARLLLQVPVLEKKTEPFGSQRQLYICRQQVAAARLHNSMGPRITAIDKAFSSEYTIC